MVKTLLLFPGVTEARLFPYLSLPMLKSYLKSVGHDPTIKDINIELVHRSIKPDVIEELLYLNSEKDSNHELIKFIGNYHEDIIESATKGTGKFDYGTSFRLLSNYLDVFFANSNLLAGFSCLEDIVAENEKVTTIADRIHDELALKTLRYEKPEILGITIAFPSQFRSAFRILKIVKQYSPNTITVIGGPQVTIREKELIENKGVKKFVDAIIAGQGENALKEMIEVMKNASDSKQSYEFIRNAVSQVKSKSIHSIQKSPAPDFDGLEFNKYLAGEYVIPLITCVGCYWGKCTFCSYGNLSLENGYQQLTSDKLTKIVIEILKKYKPDLIAFVDENCNLQLILSAAERVQKLGYEFKYSTRNRMETRLADEDFVKRLYKSGCRLMSCGYETNSQRLLDIIDKGVCAQDYGKIIETLHDNNIILRLSIMGGLPGETEQEARDSRDFLMKYSDKIGIDTMQMLVVEPCSLLATNGTHSAIQVETTGKSSFAANNIGFSYAGGRYGYSITYEPRATSKERKSWLVDTLAQISPEGNDEQHPRWKKLKKVTPRKRLKLYAWVVQYQKALLDLRWRMRYSINEQDFFIESTEHSTEITARTPLAEQALGLLHELDLGV